MRRSAMILKLTDAERMRLVSIVRSPTALNGHAQRARAVLAFADGTPLKHIATLVGVRRRIVSEWVRRFITQRFEGLDALPRSGRPPAFSPGSRSAHRQDRLRTAG
jgi:transposase